MGAVINKRCPECDEVKPLEDFYQQPSQQGVRIHPTCKKCENARPRVRNAARTIAQRARQRATAELIERHSQEFEALKVLHRSLVEREMEELARAMPEAVDPETQVVPLKPGQRMQGETIADRVADPCADCERYHGRGHRCPLCGAEPGPDTVVIRDRTGRRKVAGVKAASLKVQAEWVS